MTTTVAPDVHHVCDSTFARSLGFNSYDELIEVAEPTISIEGEVWYLVPLPAGHWLAWPYPEWDDSHRFATREEAIEFTWPSPLQSPISV